MVGPAPVTPLTRVVIVDAVDHYETGIFTGWRGGSEDQDPPYMYRAQSPPTTLTNPNIQSLRRWLRLMHTTR